MDQNHLFRDAAQQQGVLRRGVAAAHHHNGLALVAHAVAGGAVGHAPPGEGRLIFQPQLPGVGPGGQRHGAGVKIALAGVQHLGAGGQVRPLHLGVLGPCAEPLGLLLHLFPQGEAVDALFVAGVVVDDVGQGHLPARRKLFQHQRVQPGPGGIEGGGVAAGASAHHDHIVNMGVAHVRCLLTAPASPGRAPGWG